MCPCGAAARAARLGPAADGALSTATPPVPPGVDSFVGFPDGAMIPSLLVQAQQSLARLSGAAGLTPRHRVPGHALTLALALNPNP